MLAQSSAVEKIKTQMGTTENDEHGLRNSGGRSISHACDIQALQVRLLPGRESPSLELCESEP